MAADSYPSTCCRSSVVEHSIGNGEVDSSILSGSTIPWLASRTDLRSRGSKRPSFACFRHPLPGRERREDRVPAGTHDPLREDFAHANAQADNRWAGKHPAFPARWVDGLCALSPEPSSCWPPSPRELTMPRDPVEPHDISARLDRSNDGQDHALSPYAAALLCPKGTLQSVGAVRSAGSQRPHEVHLALVPLPMPGAAASTAPRPTFVATYDRPLPGSGWRNNAVNPNFVKVEYFCEGGLTGF